MFWAFVAAESTWWECLVSCSFFLWCSIEQENASVLFSHILQPKGNPFLVCVVLFLNLMASCFVGHLVLFAILFSFSTQSSLKMADKTRSRKIWRKKQNKASKGTPCGCRTTGKNWGILLFYPVHQRKKLELTKHSHQVNSATKAPKIWQEHEIYIHRVYQ